MAPEQVTGGPGIDHRADLYAFGAVAYELLTGAAPFAGRPRHEQLAAHLSEVPVPVAARQPDIPEALAALVDRLLAKHPGDRPRDAAEVLQLLDAGPLPDRPAERSTEDRKAYELYLKGRYLANTRQREGLVRAVSYFEEAVTRDSAYALAYSGMADAWAFLGIFGHVPPRDAFPKARAAAERAIALDSRLVEGHATLAHLLFAYEWNWQAAESAFERAIALDPRYPTLRMYYASFLHSVGRPEEALAQLAVASEIDPLTPTGVLSGRIYVDTRRPDAAIRVLQEAIELDPRHDLAHQLLAHAYLQKGRPDEAIASMRRAATLSGARDLAQLAYVYARTGDTAEARRVLAGLLEGGEPLDLLGFHLAMAYAALGDSDRAFRWLEAAYAQHASFMNLLAVSTGFESLHSDPRFDHMLRRMGLRSGGRRTS
jgi:serine/threonine-protein kinase